MDKQTLKAIAAKYGTPSFVFDTQALAARMRAVKEIVGSSVRLCYSIKANPFLIPAMQDLVELLEVCSPGELEICEELTERYPLTSDLTKAAVYPVNTEINQPR